MLGEATVRLERQHIDALDRLERQHMAERSLLIERVDAAEVRAELVEQRLNQVLDVLLQQRTVPAEPWWRRWFGARTQSKP
jgi:hypothetical protein